MRLAVDIETTGLDFLTDSIVAVGAIAQREGEDTQVYIWEHTDTPTWEKMRDDLRELIYEADEVIAHNASFDFPRLAYHLGIWTPRNIWDTVIAERLLIAGYDESASLEAVVERRLQLMMDKEMSTSFELGVPLSGRQKKYLYEDLLHLFAIREQQEQDIRDDMLDDVWDIEYSVTPIFCNMITRGVHIDAEGLIALINEERKEVQRLTDRVSRTLTPHVMKSRIRKFDAEKRKLDTWLEELSQREQEHADDWNTNISRIHRGIDPPYYWHEIKTHQGIDIEDETPDTNGVPKGRKRYVQHQLKAWRQHNKRPPKPKLDESDINLNSPQQLMAVFRDLGWDLSTTGTNEMKAYLPQLEGEDKEILRTIIDYRKHSKMVTAFGDPVLQFLDENNILHGQFQQYGTQTGRPTCKEPNLLQMPSTDLFRSKFIPREGHYLIVADYSQMELRLMAELSQDQAMMEAFLSGLDLHQHTASLMYGTPYELVTEKQRKVAKTINFMVLYGGGFNKLRSVLASDGVYIDENEAKKSMNMWHQTYWRASKTIKAWGRGATRYGFTETAMGRKRRFSLNSDTSEWELKGIERQGANHVIQGSNADITKLAMVLVNHSLRQHNLSGAIVLQIYDEIVVECPREEAEITKNVVRGAMLAAAEEVLQTVPAAVDAVISTSWSEKDAV